MNGMNISPSDIRSFLSDNKPRSFINKSDSTAINNDNSRLKKVCQDFEALLIKQMLNAMKKTVPDNGMMDGGMAEDIFDDMLYNKYAEVMAKSGDFGISKLLYNQLKK